MKITREKLFKKIKSALILVISNLIFAFLVAAFILPHNIIMGGATGVGVVLGRFIPLDTATIVLIFNIIVLILGGMVLGKKFLLTTVTSSVLYPIFLSVMQRIPGISTITQDPLIATIFAGGLLGMGNWYNTLDKDFEN